MSVPKPPITFIGTRGINIWPGAGVHPKRAVVLHIAEGSLAGVDSWFSNPTAQASANFGVGKDGTIHCYVDPAGVDAPFANGLLNQPDGAVQQLVAQLGGTNPNYWTVSIEHEGFHGQPTQLTPAQLHASAWLTAWLLEQYDIPLDESHLLGHYEFDSVTRANCPGLNRQGWIDYEAAVQAFLGPTPQPAPDPHVAAALAKLPAAELAAHQEAAALTAVRTALTGVAVAARPDAFQHGAPGTP